MQRFLGNIRDKYNIVTYTESNFIQTVHLLKPWPDNIGSTENRINHDIHKRKTDTQRRLFIIPDFLNIKQFGHFLQHLFVFLGVELLCEFFAFEKNQKSSLFLCKSYKIF